MIITLLILFLSSCASQKMNACWDSNGKTKRGLYK